MTTKNIDWFGEIGCEGGPVLVANSDDFSHWFGAESLDPADATHVHFWSSFTSELPLKFQPNGPKGHQYLNSESPDALRETLIKTVVEQWPGAVINRDEPTWIAMLPDGRKLNVALSPSSEYDRATRNLESEGVHTFNERSACYLWSVGPGIVRINVDSSRKFLLMTQVEFANDDTDVQVAYEYAMTENKASNGAGIQYRISQGPIVVVWSPNSVKDLSPSIDFRNSKPSHAGTLMDLATDCSGASLWLEPGLYESTLNYYEKETWGVSWCLLRRISA